VVLLATLIFQLLPDAAQVEAQEEYRELFQMSLAHGSGIAWSPDGGRLALVDYPSIQIFDTSSWNNELTISDAPASLLSWSPDGTQIASVLGGDNDRPYESLIIRNAQTGEIEQRIVRPYTGRTDINFVLGIYRLSWSPDGAYIATDSHDQNVLIWDLEAEDVYSIGSHLGTVGQVDWSPDSQQLVSTGTDNTVRVWDVATGGNIMTVKDTIDSIDWHPSQNQILRVARGNEVVISDAATGESLLVLQDSPSVGIARWNFDGALIATGDLEGNIRIWDAVAGDLLMLITEHTEVITALEWHPQQNMLGSTSLDGDARIWEINVE
jgi:WD40 repeat protein